MQFLLNHAAVYQDQVSLLLAYLKIKGAGQLAISAFVFSCPDSGISRVFNLKFQPGMSQAVDRLSFEMEQS